LNAEGYGSQRGKTLAGARLAIITGAKAANAQTIVHGFVIHGIDALYRIEARLTVSV
jgi:hypothetical protein